jgi:hypothetical protein
LTGPIPERKERSHIVSTTPKIEPDRAVRARSDMGALERAGDAPAFVSLEEVARLVEEHSRKDGFERRCKIGDAVIHGLFGGSRLSWRAQGSVRSASFRKLAVMLEGRVSKSELHRAVSVYFLCRDLTFVPTSGHLTVSHADAVEGLSRTRQEALLRRAAEERWPVARLRDEKRKALEVLRASEGKKPRGRPRATAAAALGRDALRTLSAMRRLLHDGSPEVLPTRATEHAALEQIVARIAAECAALSLCLSPRTSAAPS